MPSSDIDDKIIKYFPWFPRLIGVFFLVFAVMELKDGVPFVPVLILAAVGIMCLTIIPYMAVARIKHMQKESTKSQLKEAALHALLDA